MPKNISKQSKSKMAENFLEILEFLLMLPKHTLPDILKEKTKDGNKVEIEKKNCSHEGNTVERLFFVFILHSCVCVYLC